MCVCDLLCVCVCVYRVLKLSSNRHHDEGTISSLEQRLKQESDCRLKVEAELREQRSQASSQSAWTQEEVRDLKEQLAAKEKELAKAREEVQCQNSKNKELQKELAECFSVLRATEVQCDQLRSSLAGETRVKIELFTALSEARRKQEGLLEELQKKTAEVDGLRQSMSRLVALQSAWTPSLSPHH